MSGHCFQSRLLSEEALDGRMEDAVGDPFVVSEGADGVSQLAVLGLQDLDPSSPLQGGRVYTLPGGNVVDDDERVMRRAEKLSLPREQEYMRIAIARSLVNPRSPRSRRRKSGFLKKFFRKYCSLWWCFICLTNLILEIEDLKMRMATHYSQYMIFQTRPCPHCLLFTGGVGYKSQSSSDSSLL